ncbi:MAG TPA: hypothetical protein VL242_32910 [Sorangium sp.]|nr:hypothetical protein [Sorangium sp.]
MTAVRWTGWFTPGRRAAAALVALGAALRAALFATQPEPRVWFDTGTYLFCSLPGAAPALDRQQGYSWFLRGLRAISADLRLIQATQLTLGLITALLFYGIARRLAPRPGWAPLAALGLCLFWPTNLLLETHVLSEALFLFLVALAGYAAAEGAHRGSPWLLGAAGLAAGASASVRVVGLLVCGLLAALTIASALRVPTASAGERARRLLAPCAFVVAAGLIVLTYMSHYRSHRNAWAMESWAGINRYCMLARLIQPEHAAPDERSVALLREHGDGNLRGFDFVMWDGESPLAIAARELHLPPPALDRWASSVALSAALDRPADAGSILLDHLREATLSVGILDRHVKLTPASAAHQAVKQIYGIDVSTWHETRSFTLPYRRPLTVLKPILAAAALGALVLQLSRRHRRGYQLALAGSALLFTAAVSISILPEQRHVQLAENLMLLNIALLAGQVLVRQRAQEGTAR